MFAVPSRQLLLQLVPFLFVLLWATGFIGMKYGLPYSPPLTFMALRFALVALLLYLASLASSAPWPSRWRDIGHLAVSGLLLHGFYLGGVILSIDAGLEAGTVALIVGVQPLLVALLAGLALGEAVTPKQWLGLLLGLAGVALVVMEKLGLAQDQAAALLWALVGLLGISLATLYQKRFCGGLPQISGNCVQFTAAALALTLAAILFEEPIIDWNGHFFFALFWLVFVLSLGAVGLLTWMIRQGAATKVSSLFFLTPAVAALMAWPLFGEVLGPKEWLGVALTIGGVALVRRA